MAPLGGIGIRARSRDHRQWDYGSILEKDGTSHFISYDIGDNSKICF